MKLVWGEAEIDKDFLKILCSFQDMNGTTIQMNYWMEEQRCQYGLKSGGRGSG